MILTEEDKASLPKLYATEHDEEKLVRLKLFVPWNQWTFFILEGQEEGDEEEKDFRMFAYVVGQDNELGYVSLNELEEIRGPGGLTIEKDLYFDPTPLEKIKEKYP